VAALGDTLRKRRIEMGKTITDAEAATRIRGRLLSALENGEYAQLPNPAYVRGYIISYARWLDLDTAPLLTMYRAESGAVGPTASVPRRETVVPSREKAHAVPWKAAVIVAGLLLTVILAVWGVGSLKREEPATTIPLPTQSGDTTGTGETPGSSGEQSAAVSTGSAAATETVAPSASQPFVLKVEVAPDSASWLQIKVDGKTAYVGTLVSGQSKEFDVTSEAVVLIGRPSVVTVYRDGNKVDIPQSDNTPTVTLKASEGE
jgi:cytoskeletal protein RodZ